MNLSQTMTAALASATVDQVGRVSCYAGTATTANALIRRGAIAHKMSKRSVTLNGPLIVEAVRAQRPQDHTTEYVNRQLDTYGECMTGYTDAICEVTTACNTVRPIAYTVEFEPDHADGPRLAAYALVNPDGIVWTRDGDRWLIGWMNGRRGQNAGGVITLLIHGQIGRM